MAHPMRATDFEYRHQTLVHLLVVGLAFLAYAFQRDDIVWALVKHHTADRTLVERMVFGVGALEVLGSAALRTWAHARRFSAREIELPWSAREEMYRRLQDLIYAGRLLFALGIGLLAPISGAVILWAGEIFLVLRLFVRNRDRTRRAACHFPFPSLRAWLPAQPPSSKWMHAMRKEASKWGLAVMMIVFTLTLRDRLAEILAGASFLLWLCWNRSDFRRPTARDRNA